MSQRTLFIKKVENTVKYTIKCHNRTINISTLLFFSRLLLLSFHPAGIKANAVLDQVHYHLYKISFYSTSNIEDVRSGVKGQ